MERFIGLLDVEAHKYRFLELLTATLGEVDIRGFKLGAHIDTQHTCELLELTPTQTALICKVEHMLLYKGAGLKDVVIMLDSFKNGVKTLKTNQNSSDYRRYTEWVTTKDGLHKCRHAGNLPKAHFKWNHGTRYTLSDEDVWTLQYRMKLLMKHI